MIRDVPSEEEALLQPESRDERDAFQPVMTDSLETAILYFLASALHGAPVGMGHST